MTGPVSRLRGSAVVLAASSVVLLAGCVTLPDSSSVTAAREAGVHRERQPIAFQPRGPVPKASQPEVIQGYLAAMLAYPSEPQLVRQFMTPRAASAWDPNVRLQVYENPSVIQQRGQIRLQARILGSVDQRGSWSSTSSSTGGELNLAVTLRRAGPDKAWRIANPVQGLLVDAAHFDRYYHQYSLYYFDPTFVVFTPDPVYLPFGTAGDTATALVSNLLRGPTADMWGVVESAAPPGTRLTAPVTVSSSGYADIPLNGVVAKLGADQPDRLKLLASQLAWTLRQDFVGVTHIRITVDGRPVPVQGLGAVFSVASFRDSTIDAGSETLYALTDAGRLYARPPGVHFEPVIGPIGGSQSARSVAVNPSATFAALVKDGGHTVVAGGLHSALTEGPATTWLSHGVDVLRPSWDPYGLLWVVDRRPGGAVLEVATATHHKVVAAAGIAGKDVQSFALSRDGMRLAAVVGSGSHSQLVVAMIQRSADATKLTTLSVKGAHAVVNSDFPLTNIKGLAWVNATTVLVLARNGSSEAEPYQIAIDGSHVQATVGALPRTPVSVAAGAGSGAPPVFGSQDKKLFLRTADDQWAPIVTTLKLKAPAYPG